MRPSLISSRSTDNYYSSVEAERLIERAIRSAVERLIGVGWFSRDGDVRRDGLQAGRYGGYGSREGWNLEDAVLIDDVRRVNALAQMANSTVTPQMRHAEIHPKLSPVNGQFPREFEIPTRLDDLLDMDNIILERLMNAYGLSRSSSLTLSPLRRQDRERDFLSGYNLEETRSARLYALFEYLGVDLTGERRFGDLGGGLGGGLSRRDSGRLGGIGRLPGGGRILQG